MIKSKILDDIEDRIADLFNEWNDHERALKIGKVTEVKIGIFKRKIDRYSKIYSEIIEEIKIDKGMI